jgi:hypothetical protein
MIVWYVYEINSVADVKIIVTGRLTFDDQHYLQELVMKLKRDRQSHRKLEERGDNRPILVHNFSELTTIAQVKSVIKREIVNIFKAEVQQPVTGHIWYRSEDFDHFILARAGSIAGHYYNQRTVTLLRAHLTGRTHQPVNTVLHDIKTNAETLLRTYLIGDGDSLARSAITRTIDLSGKSIVDNRSVDLKGSLTLNLQTISGQYNSSNSIENVCECRSDLFVLLHRFW